MSLYIRLENSFWNHRKTAKLTAIIGDDALWIMPKLWSYAAEHQPNGDFRKYSSEELANLLGCSKHAPSIKDAMIASEYMDKNGRLHNWLERNQYHATFAKRAARAGKVRWEQERRQDKTRQEQA